jgi:glycine/D-amino acid oxidase-like deaminating enzyme
VVRDHFDACADLRRRRDWRVDRYFLSRRGVAATVVESTGVACAASGKSGGFLARDWREGTPLAPLARRSFDLHAELAETIADDWGYRRLDTYAGSAGFARRRGACELGWLSEAVTEVRPIGSPETTAQVHPAEFTAAMMPAAQTHGPNWGSAGSPALPSATAASPVSRSMGCLSRATPS